MKSLHHYLSSVTLAFFTLTAQKSRVLLSSLDEYKEVFHLVPASIPLGIHGSLSCTSQICLKFSSSSCHYCLLCFHLFYTLCPHMIKPMVNPMCSIFMKMFCLPIVRKEILTSENLMTRFNSSNLNSL